MIYLIYGSDRHKTHDKVQNLVNSLLKKKPDASFFKINEESWSDSHLSEYIGGQGLFSNKYIVLIDTVLKNKDIKDVLLKRLKELKESENIFIIRDNELDKVTLGKFEKYAEKVQEHLLSEPKAKKQEFNVFSLTDALGRRDKKALWVLYTKAKKEGVEDENIHGVLFWQIKSLILAKTCRTAQEAGLNPFVFSKASQFGKNFSEDELKKLSSDLIHLYHKSRRGIHGLDSALERFILSL